MKVATEILIQAPPEKIWSVIIDFPAYPEWNRFLKAVRGQPAPDSQIEVDVHYYGKNVEKKTGIVTGFNPPKYFSWVWKHSWGAWFLSSEHVLRLKEKEGGRAIFFQEIYLTGLGLKFRRRDMEHMAKLSMGKLNDDLKFRIEGVAEGQ
jgi:uncharacterized protein YndB with AHSA1/START domain